MDLGGGAGNGSVVAVPRRARVVQWFRFLLNTKLAQLVKSANALAVALPRQQIHIHRLISASKHYSAQETSQNTEELRKKYSKYGEFLTTQLKELQELSNLSPPPSGVVLPGESDLERLHKDISQFKAHIAVPEAVSALASNTSRLHVDAEQQSNNNDGEAEPRKELQYPSQFLPVAVEPIEPPNTAEIASAASTGLRQRRTKPAEASPQKLDLAAEERLEAEQSAQENLTNDLVGLARSLKTAAQRQHDLLKTEHAAKVDQLENKTEKSLAKIGSANQTIVQRLGSSWSFTLCSWLLMVIALMIFVWMYLFLRVMVPRKYR